MKWPNEGVILPLAMADTAAFARLARHGEFAVLYLGSSFADFLALPQLLPEGWTLLPVGERLNTAAAAMRQAVIDLDAAVLKTGAPRAWWDATHLGERNPLASTLSLNLARLAVLREALERHERCLVLCDDRALGWLFHAEIVRLGHKAGWMTPDRRLPLSERLRATGWVLRAFARGMRVRLRGLIECGRRRSVLRAVRRKHPLPLSQLSRADVLFVSWSRAESFPSGASMPDDPYLPRLAEAAAAVGLSAGYLMRALPGVSDYPALVRKALACATPVLLLEEFVSAAAMFGAAIRSLSLPFRIPRVVLAGQDITALLRYEAWRELSSWDAVFAYAHQAACHRLSALGVRAKTVIHPFEHQPWEKFLRSGVRRWLPGCRVIGVQHSPFAWTYLSLFPSHREIESGSVPDELFVVGEGYAKWFRDVGFPPHQLAVIGAPRYERAGLAMRVGGRNVLCCTGIELGEAIELAAKAVLASRGLERPLVINYHPVTDAAFRQTLREAVARIVDGDQAHVQYVDASAGELLSDAAVVLFCTSAAAFDALLAGIPAIYVGRDVDLNLNKVPDRLAATCTSVDDLREAIRAALASAQVGRSSAALSQWLAPFNAAAFTAALSSRSPAGRAA